MKEAYRESYRYIFTEILSKDEKSTIGPVVMAIYNEDFSSVAAFYEGLSKDHTGLFEKRRNLLLVTAMRVGSLDILRYLATKISPDESVTLDELAKNGHVDLLSQCYLHMALEPIKITLDLFLAVKCAIFKKRMDFLEELINIVPNAVHARAQFDTNHWKTEDGFTALHFAAERMNIDAMNVLYSHNVVIDAQDDLGNTPLHIIIKEKQINNVEVAKQVILSLVQKGANIHLKNLQGETPYLMAVNQNFGSWLLTQAEKYNVEKSNQNRDKSIADDYLLTPNQTITPHAELKANQKSAILSSPVDDSQSSSPLSNITDHSNHGRYFSGVSQMK